MDIMLRSFSKRHIDVSIEDKEKGAKWRFTSFYGSPMYKTDTIHGKF